MFGHRTVRILSIDGGGIRGIIPALILSRIQKRLDDAEVRKPYPELFDLIAGTSTGGIIALGLAVPKHESLQHSQADEKSHARSSKKRVPQLDIYRIAEEYRIRGERIFPRQGVQRVRDLAQAFREKYSSEEIEDLGREFLNDATLQDTLCPVLVTAYDAGRMRVQLFRSSKARVKPEENYFLRDVLRATTAAPTYFEPAQVAPKDMPDRVSTMVDGGVFAQNPALLAFQEAQRIYPSARKFQIVSIGTGKADRPYSAEQMRRWGFIDWFNPLRGVPFFVMVQDAQSKTAGYTLLHTPGVEYIRIDEELFGCSSKIDDASPKNLECLEDFVDTCLEKNQEKIERIVEILRKA